ncbi:MAG: MoxR family ATPase [Candidatus Absconditabacteria bacterium]
MCFLDVGGKVMEYIYIGVGVVLIFLLYFLYSLWKDEENIKTINLENPKQINPIVDDIKSSYVDESVFESGVAKLDIKNELILKLKGEINKSIIGMDDFINSVLIVLLADGHLLVEGVPGLAKTKTIGTLAKALDLKFKRIQFTPDMLPSDIVGVEVFNTKLKEFEVKRGPVFTNILLADEINRTTPKVQSALLESMEERQVSIGGESSILDKPFLVLATQNPIEQEGTYSLPEAQIDRFMMKVLVNYPKQYEEKKILDILENNITIEKILTKEQLLEFQSLVKQVTISNQIKDYITRIVDTTRHNNKNLLYGASPRASISLMFASKAVAFLQGRDYVTHEDVQKLVLNVMRHRIILTYEAQVQGYSPDSILLGLLKDVTLE